MVNQVMYRASVRQVGQTLFWDTGYYRWSIPVLFRSWDAAVDAATKSAYRRAVRYGGEWKIEINRERVVIV